MGRLQPGRPPRAPSAGPVRAGHPGGRSGWRSRRVLAAALGSALWLGGCGQIADGTAGTPRAPLSGGAAASSQAPRAELREGERGRVTRVVDGDTLDVEGVGRIRIIGIDTPERGECGFDSATQALAALVAGEVVTLTPGAQTDADQYARLLRYVDVAGVDAGLILIEQGWAIARYDSRDGYGWHPRQQRYVTADEQSVDLGCYPD